MDVVPQALGLDRIAASRLRERDFLFHATFLQLVTRTLPCRITSRDMVREMTMKKMDHTADFILWTPWGPQRTRPASNKVAVLREGLRRLKATRDKTELKDREDIRLDKPECSYEP